MRFWLRDCPFAIYSKVESWQIRLCRNSGRVLVGRWNVEDKVIPQLKKSLGCLWIVQISKNALWRVLHRQAWTSREIAGNALLWDFNKKFTVSWGCRSCQNNEPLYYRLAVFSGLKSPEAFAGFRHCVRWLGHCSRLEGHYNKSSFEGHETRHFLSPIVIYEMFCFHCRREGRLKIDLLSTFTRWHAAGVFILKSYREQLKRLTRWKLRVEKADLPNTSLPW